MGKRRKLTIKNYVALTEEGLKVKEFLSQYSFYFKHIRRLEERERMIREDFEISPLSAVKLDGMPFRPSGEGSPVGAASLALKVDDIQTKLRAERSRALDILNATMDVIGYLPQGSREREIIEMRYIDCMDWQTIVSECHYEKTPAVRRLNRGLNELGSNALVMMIISSTNFGSLSEESVDSE